MKTSVKILIVIALAACVAGAVALKQSKAPSPEPPAVTAAVASESSAGPLDGTPPGLTATAARPVAAKLPRLLDLGAGKCIPCKMMKPILDDLKANYADRFTTEFIDVWENPDAGRKYGIEMIPTQIFYDAEGKELFRHVGFFGKEDILAKWKDLGVDVAGRLPAAAN